MKLSYVTIDAFTAGQSGGNPAACIYLEQDETLPKDLMQSIARDHAGVVSEVAFCTPRADGSYGLRYFSSEREVDFCGHATIGCMYYLLKNNQAAGALPEVTIHTEAKGSLVVYNSIQDLDAVFITAPEPVSPPFLLEEKKIAEALGISSEALSPHFPVQVINAGLTTLLVPMATLHTTLALQPDMHSLRAFTEESGLDIILVFSTEVADSANLLRTRVFAPRFGYLEDTATGSGNAAMGYYMLWHGMWQGEAVTIEQNGELALFNRVCLKTRAGKVLFGGGGTVKREGSYFV